MDWMERYAGLEGRQLTFGKNTRVLTEDPVIAGLFDGLAGEGNVVEAAFLLGVPEEVREGLRERFGVDYVPREEGYVIRAGETVQVYAETGAGLFHGANGLLRHVQDGSLQEGISYAYPDLKLRGVKVYVPARENIGHFKEMADYCALYGYNTLMLEIGGAMEYKKHPEINEGWVRYCKNFQDYQGQSLDIQNAPNWARNSIHMENGGGSFLTQEEMRGLISYLRERHFDIIPEVPTLSHCDYLLTAHPELREREEDDLPDTYCPSNPDSYKLVFDVLDEVIDVFAPRIVNIGHDEFFTMCKCEKCRGRNAAELYAQDIIKIHDYLKDRHVRTMMWSELLLNDITKQGISYGGGHRFLVNMKTNLFMEERPAIYPAIDLLPRDILMLHWFWGRGRQYEMEFRNRGYEVVFGNFSGMGLIDFEGRKDRTQGIVISNWGLLDQGHLQRNGVLFNIAYSAGLAWNPGFKEENHPGNLLEVANGIYARRLSRAGHALEFLHHTTLRKEHPAFVDGYMIDKKDDYLGRYHLVFESGRTMDVPLYYNLNIGTVKADLERRLHEDLDCYTSDGQLLESTYSCGIEVLGQEVYYRYFVELPEGERLASVAVEEDSKYGPNIIVKGIRCLAAGVGRRIGRESGGF